MFEGASDLEIGYVAGIFDGEGCIVTLKASESPIGVKQPRIAIVSTDEDLTMRVAEIVGEGRIYARRPVDGRKPSWEWNLAPIDLVWEFLEVVMPLLCARRQDRILDVFNECAASREISCKYCEQLFVTHFSSRYCSEECKRAGTDRKSIV